MQGDIACTLGDFSFLNFEVPERVDHFGRHQKVVIHDFPGGIRTTQAFGGFPPDIIKWEGQLFEDDDIGDLYQRVNTLQSIIDAGAPVQLTVGQFQYYVMPISVEFHMRLQFWLPYQLALVPFFDVAAPYAAPLPPQQTGIASPTQLSNNTPPLAPSSNLAASTQLPPQAPAISASGAPVPSAITMPIAPAPGKQLGALNSSNQQLSDQISQSNQFPSVPASAINSLTSFQQSLNAALQSAQVNSTALQGTTLLNGLASAQSTVQDLANSAITGNAVFGVNSRAVLGLISDQLNPNSTAAPVVAQVVNPDLFRLANQYYGDAKLWAFIANDSRNKYPNGDSIQTPFPLGIFSLTIPALP